MIAGVFVRKSDLGLPSGAESELRKAISRSDGSRTRAFVSPQAILLRAATGALSDYDGVDIEEDRYACVLAGEPLFGPGAPSSDHREVVRALMDDRPDALAESRGVFAGALYRVRNEGGELVLFNDRLGVRPLYFVEDGGVVTFASALRILEALPWVRRRRDLTGIAEDIGIGFPLADRTRYEGVHLLREAQVVTFFAGGRKDHSYWRWSDIPEINVERSEAVRETYRLFREAIEIRQRDNPDALAYLSGGMDSRAIVGALCDGGVRVQAVNFAPLGSQDQEFADRFAQAIGCDLETVPRPESPPGGFRVALAKTMGELIDSESLTATRPRAVWSGDGGSVSLGNVYLDDQMAAAMRSDDIGRAIDLFTAPNSLELPLGVFHSSARSKYGALIEASIRSELERHETGDPASALFLFLMANDQRRHLNDFYEELDSHGLEYQLPFFDGKLLEFVFSLPLDYRMAHRFYTDWFDAFPDAVRASPWQTYPGHEPCPLPVEETLAYQWAPKSKSYFDSFGNRFRLGLRSAAAAASPHSIRPLSRSRLSAVAAMQLVGLRDYTQVTRAAELFRRRRGET